MNKTIRILSAIAKGLALLSGLAAYADMLPPKWGPIGIIAFGVVSWLKDSIRSLGDLLDDGKINDSFKPQ